MKLTSRISVKLKKQLVEEALKAQKNAHAPYSGFQVGAAILAKTGKIYSGCNVENASYGATVCAERGAIQTAVASAGKLNIAAVCVVTTSNDPWPPCGICRQVIVEFSEKNIPIFLYSTQNRTQKKYTINQLLPQSFSSTNMAISNGKKTKK